MTPEATVRRLTWRIDSGPQDLPASELEWLGTLAQPTLLALPGRDETRTRVVSTLLHGNEPSGLRAIHRLLRDDPQPSTNLLFFIGAVEAALAEPGFAHRALPGRADLNRCFRPPFRSHEALVARDALAAIVDAAPECLVDLHNNTGHSPAYGVAFELGSGESALVSLFADQVVHTPISLGTLVEATLETCPSVTIECGTSGDPEADDVAYAGLVQLAERDRIDFERPDRSLRVLVDPIRVHLRAGTDLAFDDTSHPDVDLTLTSDIDRHNFDRLPPGTPIGWLRTGAPWPFNAEGPTGDDLSRRLITRDGNRLVTAREFVPIMMTTDRDIALSDCLFYAVQPAPEEKP